VATIFLFGSRATDTASPLSDRDIGVLLKVPPPETEHPNFYLPFYELFTDLFPDSQVDIVILFPRKSWWRWLEKKGDGPEARGEPELRFNRNEAARQICVVLPPFCGP
jgi:predicted nucleotidyltransferase